MDLFSFASDVKSLDQIGVQFDEDSLRDTSSNDMLLFGGLDAQTHDSTEDTEGTSTPPDAPQREELMPTDTITSYHGQQNALGTTFSGHPVDIVRFRSCINSNVPRNKQQLATFPPEQNGPFSADILTVIFLYIDAQSAGDILQVSTTCKLWRFYSNFSPHWTYFRRLYWKEHKLDIPKYIRKAVVKPKVVTREEYILERQKVEDCKRIDRLLSTAKHIRWCLAIAIMVGVMITSNLVFAYFLGFLRTALRSDVNLAITTLVLMVVLTFIEVVVVISPLGRMSSPSSARDGSLRILSWCALLFTVSVLFGVITALAFTRVQAEGHVLERPTMDFTMNAECTTYSGNNEPSFAFLPALLTDLRWRPITTDATGETFEYYCLRLDSTKQCYALLFFDPEYESDVFNNATALELYKNVGSTTAFGFDPFVGGKPIDTWCAYSNRTQVIAVTDIIYAKVKAERDALYPTAVWLDSSQRPTAFYNYSFRCSSKINREKTENPQGSTSMWYEHSPPWSQYYVPLLSDTQQVRATFTKVHRHFLLYVYACYGITAGLWGLMFLGQAIFRHSAATILGTTTIVMLVAMNPISLLVSGILCVHVTDGVFMCSASSGGAMIGGGVAMIFMLATIYVSAAGYAK